MEYWKLIDEITYKNYYISNLGRVKNDNGHIYKKAKSNSGYLFVILTIGKNKTKHFYIHRLVATYFIENSNSYPVVNHINENRLDNRVENLEWVTYKQNSNYGNSKNRISEKNKLGGIGHIPIIVHFPNGDVLKAHSLREASRITGVSRSAIQLRLENKQGTFPNDIYKFEYADANKTSNNKAIKKYDNGHNFAKKMTYAEIVERINHVNPNLEVISSTNGTHGKITVVCRKCGTQYQTTPNWIFGGAGKCPKCH